MHHPCRFRHSGLVLRGRSGAAGSRRISSPAGRQRNADAQPVREEEGQEACSWPEATVPRCVVARMSEQTRRRTSGASLAPASSSNSAQLRVSLSPAPGSTRCSARECDEVGGVHHPQTQRRARAADQRVQAVRGVRSDARRPAAPASGRRRTRASRRAGPAAGCRAASPSRPARAASPCVPRPTPGRGARRPRASRRRLRARHRHQVVGLQCVLQADQEAERQHLVHVRRSLPHLSRCAAVALRPACRPRVRCRTRCAA